MKPTLLCDTIYFGHTWSADILSYSVINIIDWKDDIPYTIYNTNSSSLDCWHRAGWIHVFMLQMPNFGLAICRPDHIFSILNCLVLVSLCPLKSQSCVLGHPEWNPEWSSAVVVPSGFKGGCVVDSEKPFCGENADHQFKTPKPIQS